MNEIRTGDSLSHERQNEILLLLFLPAAIKAEINWSGQRTAVADFDRSFFPSLALSITHRLPVRPFIH